MQPPRQSLVPGYRHVDNFGGDSDYEDEEVSYVTLDLGPVEPALVPSSSTYRLIGLDTSTPFLQLSGTIFKGQHDSLLGTEILFTDSKENSDKTGRPAVHVTNTDQRVRFQMVQLKQKTTQEKTGTNGDNGSISTFLEHESELLDQVVGKVAPIGRPPRARKGISKKSKVRKGMQKERDLIEDDNQNREASSSKQNGEQEGASEPET